jgi:hypothetical protein
VGVKFDAEHVSGDRWRITVLGGEQFLAGPDRSRYRVAIGEVEIAWGETFPPRPIGCELVTSGERPRSSDSLVTAAIEHALARGASHRAVVADLLAAAATLVEDIDDVDDDDRRILRSAVRAAAGLLHGLPSVRHA